MKRLFSIGVIAASMLCTSCGIDTRNWPTIQLNFNVDSVESISFDYTQNANKYREAIQDSFVLESKDSINEIVERFLDHKYKAIEEKNFDSSKFSCRAILDFNVQEEEQIKSYRYSLYELGIEDCRVIFPNGEVHFTCWDLASFYKSFKNK